MQEADLDAVGAACMRVLRLFKRVESLNKILTALLNCIPGVVNAFIVMLIATTVVQIVVDNFIDQIVISRALVLHPLTIMIGLFTSRLLWGIVGMVLSIPLLGSLKTTLAGTAHPYAQALAAVLEGDMKMESGRVGLK